MGGKNIQKIMSVSLSAIVVLWLCACGDSGYTSDTGYYYQDKDADLDAVTPPEDETAESVGAEAPAGGRNTGEQEPHSRGEGILIHNSWSVVTGPSNDQGADKHPFLCQRCIISLREIVLSELSEPLSYR